MKLGDDTILSWERIINTAHLICYTKFFHGDKYYCQIFMKQNDPTTINNYRVFSTASHANTHEFVEYIPVTPDNITSILKEVSDKIFIEEL